MKKQLLIAAVAATMSVAATADISITGDAIVSFSNSDIGKTASKNSNTEYQRVRLKVVGSTGDTKVTAVLRNNGSTRVDKQGGNGDWDALQMDSLYVTTKVGSVDIKAGDHWGTTGLGVRSKNVAKKNAFSASTKIASGWKLGVFTDKGSVDTDLATKTIGGADSTELSASGKIGPVKVGLVHNPSLFTDMTAQFKYRGVSIATEFWDDEEDNKDTFLFHASGEERGFKWDTAYIKNDIGTVDGKYTNKKFAPLGSMLIGKRARGVTETAAANVGDFTKILGVAVSTKLSGNTVKVIYTKNTIGAGSDLATAEDKVTGTELIVSRPLGGATLTANIAKLSNALDEALNATNMGFRLDVKF